jgi:hypothetical protein
MSDAEAPAAPSPEAPAAPAAPTVEATPSVAGGAELGKGISGRAAAIAKASAAMNAHQAASREQAVQQATESADKARAKAERDKAPDRGEDGRFKPNEKEPPKPEEKQGEKPAEPEKPKAPDDDKSELEKLEEEWRKVRSAKKAARNERRGAASWREEQARAKAEAEADERLRKDQPATWLEKHGYSFYEEAKRAVAKADETPADKRAKEAEARALAAEEKANALERRINEREAAAAQKDAMAQLVNEHTAAWAETKSDYPTLLKYYPEQEVLDTAIELRIDYYRNTKREIPISAALSHMEKEARQHRERFTREPEGKPERTERATVAAKSGKTRAVIGPVTNRQAATSATPRGPLSPEEKRARATQIASRGWRQ